MIGLILTSAVNAAANALGKALRAGLVGLVLGIVLMEALAALLNTAAGSPGFVSFHIWPPTFNTDVFTLFVHISAVLFGLVLALAMVLWVIVGETIRGLLFAVNHADNAALDVIQHTIGRAGSLLAAPEAPIGQNLIDQRGSQGMPPL
jgi:hypothetical protein